MFKNIFKNKYVFTDYELLNTIQKLYEQDYLRNMDEYKKSRISRPFYVSISCDKIAKKMNLDVEIIFYRLSFHLNDKYQYTQEDKTKIHLFNFDLQQNINPSINYPYLCSVLADERDKKREKDASFWLSISAIIVSIASVLINFYIK